jgi:monoamine oxidase
MTGNFIFTGYKGIKVKRREALKQLGFGLSTTLVGGSYLTSCKKDDPGPEVPYDGIVAIIGAGVAGLSAADILRAKGVNVIVLEASKQLGGRVRSLKNQQGLQSIADFPVELGAEFFQGTDSLVGTAAINMNVQTVDLSAGKNHFIMDATAKDAEGWGSDADFIASQNFVEGIESYTGASRSVGAEVADLGDRPQGMLNGQIGNFYGTTNDSLGMRGLSEQLQLVQHSKEYRTLKHNSLQDFVASRFDAVISKVRFEAPVKSINYGSDLVTLTLESGETIDVNKVIITVPVPILKTGITFSPALPEVKRTSLNRIGMDPCMRVILDFKKNFWGEDSVFIWGGTSAPQMFNAGFGRSEFFKTMSVTICGPKALELSSKSETEVVDEILAEIDLIYNGQGSLFIRKELDELGVETNKVYFIQDWTKDPYVQGGFSYSDVVTSVEDRKTLGNSVAGKLFFGGEATDINGDAGTLNGALASAARVVEEIVLSIRGEA